jgi:hypothetical protein
MRTLAPFTKWTGRSLDRRSYAVQLPEIEKPSQEP